LAVAAGIVLALNWQVNATLSPEPEQTTAAIEASQPSQPTTVVAGSPEENQFTVSIGDEITKGVPEPGAGFIEAPGSRDIYAFTAEPGQRIYIHIIENKPTDPIKTMDIYLTDELGQNVIASCVQCGDPGAITLDRGGIYTLTIGNTESSNQAAGTYRIKLWELPPSDVFEINIGDKISNGTPGEGAGFIEVPGANDIYTFAADPGQTVYFQIVQPPQTSDVIYWHLMDQVEQKVFDSCLQCGDPGLVTLEQGGTYTMVVGNQNQATTGTYSIRVWNVPPPDIFTITVGDEIGRDVPGAGAGNIESPGAHDIYNFTLSESQSLTFQVIQPPQTNDTIYWRVVDEQGNEIFNTCLHCGDQGPFTLEAGEYSMIVGNQNQPGTGTYQLAILTP
jgi:hypothetical protein